MSNVNTSQRQNLQPSDLETGKQSQDEAERDDRKHSQDKAEKGDSPVSLDEDVEIVDWDSPTDPQNPRNWPRWKKKMHIFLLGILTLNA